MTVGSLFAGIGGFDLGFERAGYDVRWQVEINGYCRAVLRKHWPDVRRYADVRRVGAHNLEPVDVICGGFPCQDISSSNKHKTGIVGRKSWLWREMLRVVRELRPRYIVMENVSDLLIRGMGTVLGDLAALGLDAEWECVPAAGFGLPQRRWRVFLIAYPYVRGCEVGSEWIAPRSLALERVNSYRLAQAQHLAAQATRLVRGMDDGLPGTVDRVDALGNSVAPEAAEWIASRITEAEALRAA